MYKGFEQNRVGYLGTVFKTRPGNLGHVRPWVPEESVELVISLNVVHFHCGILDDKFI